MESHFDTDVDFNREIRHAGFSQLASAPAIMIPTVTYLGMLVAWDMGARSFVPPAMVIGGSLALVFLGSGLVAQVPNFMFAALLVSSGINMIWDNLRSAWNMLPVREFCLVIVHIVLTAMLGMLSAVVLGILFTATIFIVEYSSHSGVLQSATLLLERSKVQRTSAEQEILEQCAATSARTPGWPMPRAPMMRAASTDNDLSRTRRPRRYGATVLIVHLHGMIFFGSANSVLEEIKTHLMTLSELQLPLKFLLLDFDRCSAIDSSAVAVLFQTRRQIKDAGLIFACAGESVLSMLAKGAPGEREFEHFTTLDLALEQCENRLLVRYMLEHGHSRDPTSPVSIRPTARLTGIAQGGLSLFVPGDLQAIDEKLPMGGDEKAGLNPGGGGMGRQGASGWTLSNPSSDDEHMLHPPGHPDAPLSLSLARAGGGRDGGGTAYKMSHKKRFRSAAERLPNPFGSTGVCVGEHEGQPAQYRFPRAPGGAGAGTVSGSAPSLPGATGPGAGAGAAPAVPGQPGGEAVAHPSDGSDGQHSDSSTGGGLATIYSPEQARAELRPEALAKMRDRFTEAMLNAYGSRVRSARRASPTPLRATAASPSLPRSLAPLDP